MESEGKISNSVWVSILELIFSHSSFLRYVNCRKQSHGFKYQLYVHGFQIYISARSVSRTSSSHIQLLISHLCLDPLKPELNWFPLLPPRPHSQSAAPTVSLISVNGSSRLSPSRPKNLGVILDPALSHLVCHSISKSHWFYLCSPSRIWQLSLTMPILFKPASAQIRWLLLSGLTSAFVLLQSFWGQQPNRSLKIKSRSYCMSLRCGFLSHLEQNPKSSRWQSSGPCRVGSLTSLPASLHQVN